MGRHAFMAKIDPQRRETYIAAHLQVPAELLARYHQAGLRNISIFLRENLAFLYLESENWADAMAALENDPVELDWQKLIGPMLDDAGYSECGEIFHAD
jgi:L-rhamnose mutarotase